MSNERIRQLYYGDCLTVMRDMDDESVDLVYLDPPFNSKATYNILFKPPEELPVARAKITRNLGQR